MEILYLVDWVGTFLEGRIRVVVRVQEYGGPSGRFPPGLNVEDPKGDVEGSHRKPRILVSRNTIHVSYEGDQNFSLGRITSLLHCFIPPPPMVQLGRVGG